ncbi:MAG: glycosyltransferase family 4 protein [Gemmataceae bacterium]
MPPAPPSPVAAARRFAGRLRQSVRDWWRGETAATFFDVHNPHEVATLFAEHGLPVPTAPGSAEVARRVWELRRDLREAFPLGLTPAQRRAYAGWLLTHGRADFGLAPADVLAYLRELATDPSHGLVQSFRWHPDWQRPFAAGLTPATWPHVKQWVGEQYRVPGRWLGRAKLPAADIDTPTHAPGVNLLGHFRFPSGLQEIADALATGFRTNGLPVALRDLPVGYPCDVSAPTAYADLERYGVTVASVGAGRGFDGLFPAAGLPPRASVYRVANWAWELEQFPREAVAAASLADEFWAISEFCATAIRKVVPDGRPVFAMPPGVPTPDPAPLGREHFGLKPGRFVVLFVFDMGSAMGRKNPLGLIQAFRKAFRPDEPADLVLKVSRGSQRPADLAALTAACRDNGVSLIDRVMPRAEVLALMNACHCYASLHRSEGLGYTVAEAMLLGKPVVSTDYSATTEFLTPEVGLPVDYRLVPVGDGHPPYPADARWAEPDVEYAAVRLRWVYDNREAARSLGAKAKEYAARVLDPTAAGRRMADRVRQLFAERAGKP